jgi:transposase-like protein
VVWTDPLRRQRPWRRVARIISAAYTRGVSIRPVDEPVKAMGMSGISENQVSRCLREEIDGKVKALLERPIEGDWPPFRLAWERRSQACVKVRQASRVVAAAMIVAAGVNSCRRRGVLGMDIGPSEAEPYRAAFLRKSALDLGAHVTVVSRTAEKAADALALGRTSCSNFAMGLLPAQPMR